MRPVDNHPRGRCSSGCSRDDPASRSRALVPPGLAGCAARYTRFALPFAPYLGNLGEGTPCPTMNLSVRDAASLLKVSEKTIYRWIQQQSSRPIACRSSTASIGPSSWSGRPHVG